MTILGFIIALGVGRRERGEAYGWVVVVWEWYSVDWLLIALGGG
jgi:hypothetical protein